MEPSSIAQSENYYKTGDYAGSLDEVKRTVATFGCPDVVEYVPGFFENTLAFVQTRHLALIWADVDLESSMNSVLRALYPRLDRESSESGAKQEQRGWFRDNDVCIISPCEDHARSENAGVPGNPFTKKHVPQILRIAPGSKFR